MRDAERLNPGVRLESAMAATAEPSAFVESSTFGFPS